MALNGATVLQQFARVDFYNYLMILVTMCTPLYCKRASKAVWFCNDMVKMLKGFIISPTILLK